MKKILTIFTLLYVITLVAQKTCDSKKEEALEDLNNITKCSFTPVGSKKTKGAKTLNVKISTNRKRYLKKTSLSLKSAMLAKIKEKNRAMKLSSVTDLLSSKEIKSAKGFAEADRIPGFKKCFGSRKQARLECFNEQMMAHINKNFHYPVNAIQKKIQAKIWVRFIIDKNGSVRNIKTVSTNPSVDTSELEQVARFVVNKLPKFQPGIKGGVAIPVKYGFPIEFSLED